MKEQRGNDFNRLHDTVTKTHTHGQGIEGIIQQHQVRHPPAGCRTRKHRHTKISLFER